MKVLIHCKDSATKHLKSLGLKYKESDGELDVIVNDVPYAVINGIYQDPDEQLCEHYGIDYDQVNCIEVL
jgi:hypothetical protein